MPQLPQKTRVEPSTKKMQKSISTCIPTFGRLLRGSRLAWVHTLFPPTGWISQSPCKSACSPPALTPGLCMRPPGVPCIGLFRPSNWDSDLPVRWPTCMCMACLVSKSWSSRACGRPSVGCGWPQTQAEQGQNAHAVCPYPAVGGGGGSISPPISLARERAIMACRRSSSHQR